MASKRQSELVSIGKDAAIELHDSGFWKDLSHRQRAEFQMIVHELSMPFDVFHESLEAALGRPVFTHELGLNFDGIWDELFNNGPAPSMQQIIDLIPADKRLVVHAPDTPAHQQEGRDG